MNIEHLPHSTHLIVTLCILPPYSLLGLYFCLSYTSTLFSSRSLFFFLSYTSTLFSSRSLFFSPFLYFHPILFSVLIFFPFLYFHPILFSVFIFASPILPPYSLLGLYFCLSYTSTLFSTRSLFFPFLYYNVYVDVDY